MGAVDLPAFPPKGERQKLDNLWLAKLQTEGSEALSSRVTGPPPELDRAILQFNRQQFWECHETLELLWLPEPYPLRLFYHGLIKAAVGMIHLSSHNRRGARLKLSDGISTLAPFVPEMMGVNVVGLCGELGIRLKLVQIQATINWGAVDGLAAIRIRGS